MAEDKKERRKQQLNKSTDQCLESTIEVETGIPDTDFVDHAKLKKLAYLTVIQRYLRMELERDCNQEVIKPTKKTFIFGKRKKKRRKQLKK